MNIIISTPFEFAADAASGAQVTKTVVATGIPHYLPAANESGTVTATATGQSVTVNAAITQPAQPNTPEFSATGTANYSIVVNGFEKKPQTTDQWLVHLVATKL